MEWVQSLLQPEFQGKQLQKSGPLSREQLIQFFEKGTQLFDDPQFKAELSEQFRQHQNVQDFVNAMQGKVFEEHVQPPVQGDYGIMFLSKVRTMYSNDAELLKTFYEFVHREEMVLDEAELPPEQFHQRNQQMAAMRAFMEQQAQQLQGLPVQQQQQLMAQAYQKMVEQGMQSGGQCQQPNCSHGHGHGHGTHGHDHSHGQAAGAADATAIAADAASRAMGSGMAVGAMSEHEQLVFFQAMQRGGAVLGGSR